MESTNQPMEPSGEQSPADTLRAAEKKARKANEALGAARAAPKFAGKPASTTAPKKRGMKRWWIACLLVAFWFVCYMPVPQSEGVFCTVARICANEPREVIVVQNPAAKGDNVEDLLLKQYGTGGNK